MAYARLLVTMGISTTLALAAACGGTSSGVGAANDGGPADATGGTDGAGDSATPQEASSGTDGAGPVDSGGGGDSSEPPAEGGATGTLACGMGTTCTAPAQVCCGVAGKGAGDGGSATSSCVAAGSCKGVSISCEGTDNCGAGNKCCFSGGQGSPSASCEPTCANGAQVCNKQSDCPASETCRSVGELGGLGLCEAAPADAGGE